MNEIIPLTPYVYVVHNIGVYVCLPAVKALTSAVGRQSDHNTGSPAT